jgi:hypothetical protein
MKKNRFGVSLLALLLVVSSCQKGNSSLSVEDSSVLSSTPVSSSVDPGVNLEGDPKTYPAQDLSDDLLLQLMNSVDDDPKSALDFYKPTARERVISLLKAGGITDDDLKLVISIIVGAKQLNYVKTNADFRKRVKDIKADVTKLLAAVEGDQIGYLLQALVKIQLSESSSNLPTLFNITLKTAYEGLMTIVPAAAKSLFSSYADLFSDTITWALKKDLDIPTETYILLGRFLKNVLAEFFAAFTDDEVANLTTMGMVVGKTSMPLMQVKAFKDIATATEADLPSYLNKLGTVLAKAKPSAASFAALHDSLISAVDVFSAAIPEVMNNRYYVKEEVAAQQAMIKKIEKAVTTDVIEALYQLITEVLLAVTSKDVSAIVSAKSLNPIQQLLGTFQTALGKLTDSQQSAIKGIFTELGLKYDDVVTILTKDETLDFSSEDDMKQFMKDISPIVLAAKQYVTIEHPFSDVGFQFKNSRHYFPKTYTFTKADFEVTVEVDDEEVTSVIKTIPTFDSASGQHEGEVTVEYPYTDEDGKAQTGTLTLVVRYETLPYDLIVDTVSFSTTDATLQKKIDIQGTSSSLDEVMFPKSLTLEDEKKINIYGSVYVLKEDSHYSFTSLTLDKVKDGTGLDLSSEGLKYAYATSKCTYNGQEAQVGIGFQYYVYDDSKTSANYLGFINEYVKDYVIQNGSTGLFYEEAYDLKNAYGGYAFFLGSSEESEEVSGDLTAELGEKTVEHTFLDGTKKSLPYTVLDPEVCLPSGVNSITKTAGGTAEGVLNVMQNEKITSFAAISFDYTYFGWDAGMLTVENPEITDLDIDTTLGVGNHTGSFYYENVKLSFSYKINQATN